ncbi:MAG: hypothetical protein HYZ86_01885 [Candidatus Omnitrophica bacterium]|nr:hypothetical protein [Candidatus Omnitrophota bacterium]
MFKKKRGQTLRHGSGQSTVEYILLATAVIAVMVLFTTGNDSVFKARLSNAFNAAADSISDMGNRLKNSEGPTPLSDDPNAGTQDSIRVNPGAGFNAIIP